jgi:hypothetical protein
MDRLFGFGLSPLAHFWCLTRIVSPVNRLFLQVIKQVIMSFTEAA